MQQNQTPRLQNSKIQSGQNMCHTDAFIEFLKAQSRCDIAFRGILVITIEFSELVLFGDGRHMVSQNSGLYFISHEKIFVLALL